MVDFYQWYIDSGACSTMVNNAGDPFHPHGEIINALSFEREFIEFFGPLYGFDKNNLWGLVTFSGTDGNNHGIYFGAKYLEKVTGKNLFFMYPMPHTTQICVWLICRISKWFSFLLMSMGV